LLKEKEKEERGGSQVCRGKPLCRRKAGSARKARLPVGWERGKKSRTPGRGALDTEGRKFVAHVDREGEKKKKKEQRRTPPPGILVGGRRGVLLQEGGGLHVWKRKRGGGEILGRRAGRPVPVERRVSIL